MSVCTGVSLLGKCGFVDGLTVTTHHLAYDRVAPDCPKTKFCKCRRFIDHGHVLTSAGRYDFEKCNLQNAIQSIHSFIQEYRLA